MRALWPVLCAGVITCIARTAAAGCDAPVVSPCIDSDTFWPHAGPSLFMNVGGTETVAADRIAFGLVATYLSRPIVLHVPSPGSAGSDRPAVDNEVNATFLFAYGVTDRLELDLALPVTIFQDGAGVSPLLGCGGTVSCSVPATATRDMRFGATYTFLKRPKKHPWRHDASGFGLAARFETSAPTGDENAFAGERAAIFIPSISLDYRSYRFFAGAEVGVRIRPTTDFAGARIGTQGMVSAGVGLDLLKRHDLLAVTAEARVLPVFTEQADVSQGPNGLQSSANGAFITPAEWMVSARTAPFEGGDLTLQLGVGGWLPTSGFAPATAPRFRAALGLSFAPRGTDTDGDGVPDAIDKCPLDAGPKVSEVGTGCPDKAP
jgi:OmpA-OmpF porin, OOP family